MSKLDLPKINPSQLVDEWRNSLPTILKDADHAEISVDTADPQALLITITTAGHSGYSFDFKVTYMDAREIKIDLIDVEQDHIHVDENTEIIQSLIEVYRRHMHECAQVLKKVTT